MTMELLFYLFGTISVIFSLGVVLNFYPVYALLCLIASFLSISCLFFILGAYLAGALEVIIYAGAIMVLFIFVIMMLNVDFYRIKNTGSIIRFNLHRLFLLFIFLVIFIYVVLGNNNDYCVYDMQTRVVTLKSIGLSLFGPYVLVVEMASMLLLAALLISLRIVRSN